MKDKLIIAVLAISALCLAAGANAMYYNTLGKWMDQKIEAREQFTHKGN